MPAKMRAVFVLRAVAGFTAAETATLLQKHGGAHGGPQAAAWTPEAVREVFRQGLCSLARNCSTPPRRGSGTGVRG
jgi:hypothetical protein